MIGLAAAQNGIPVGIERSALDFARLSAKLFGWAANEAQLMQGGLILFAFLAAWLLVMLTAPLIVPALEEMGSEHIARLRRAGRGLVLFALWGVFLLIISRLLKLDGRPFQVVHALGVILISLAIIRMLTRLLIPPIWSRPAALALWLVATLEILGLRAPFATMLEDFGVRFGSSYISALSVIEGVTLLAAGLPFAGWLGRAIEGRIEKAQAMDPAAKLLIAKLSRLGAVIVVILLAIQAVGVDLTALSLFGGALGLGIGFGLQKVISNLVSGFILILDRSLRPGDVIQIGVLGGQWGWVEKLGARYTTVRSRDGTETLIPNETLITSPVTNWSFSDRKIRVSLDINVAYETDIEKAMALCLEAANAVDRVLDTPRPNCFLVGFGDSAVNLELRFWIDDPEDGLRNVKSAINLEIWRRFREHGIEIPNPQRDLHLRSAVPLSVMTKNPERPAG